MISVYTPDGSRALIGAIDIRKRTDNTSNNTNSKKNDVEVDGLGLKERAKGSNVSRNMNGGVSTSPNMEYSIDEFIGKEDRDRGVNFKVYEGDRVLISGPSGTGKSSLLRAISGLWEMGDGRISWKASINQTYIKASHNGQCNFASDGRVRNNSVGVNGGGGGKGGGGGGGAVGGRAPDDVFFLPQKPYNILGTLRQQIAYPGCYPDYSTEINDEGDKQGMKGVKGSGRVNVKNVTFGNEKDDDDDNNDENDNDDNNKKKERSMENMMGIHRDEVHGITNSIGTRAKGVFDTISEQDKKFLNILMKVNLGSLASRMGGGNESIGLEIEKDWSKVGTDIKMFHLFAIEYSTVQYSTVQYSTVQYSTVQYSTVQYSTAQHRRLKRVRCLFKLCNKCKCGCNL